MHPFFYLTPLSLYLARQGPLRLLAQLSYEAHNRPKYATQRERERQRDRDRETERDTERERDRERQRETGETERERERERETERQRDREREVNRCFHIFIWNLSLYLSRPDPLRLPAQFCYEDHNSQYPRVLEGEIFLREREVNICLSLFLYLPRPLDPWTSSSTVMLWGSESSITCHWVREKCFWAGER